MDFRSGNTITCPSYESVCNRGYHYDWGPPTTVPTPSPTPRLANCAAAPNPHPTTAPTTQLRQTVTISTLTASQYQGVKSTYELAYALILGTHAILTRFSHWFNAILTRNGL